jgi:hypothetical protein
MKQRQSIDALEESQYLGIRRIEQSVIRVKDLVLQLIEEKNAAIQRLKEMEFDNWTMRSTLVQLRQESEEAMKELATVKVCSSMSN